MPGERPTPLPYRKTTMKTKYTPQPWILDILRAIGVALLVAILQALGLDVEVTPRPKQPAAFHAAKTTAATLRKDE